jgi:hypothetical protein
MSPQYIVDAGSVEEETSWVLVLRGRTQFSITVQHQEIEATDFGVKYLALIRTHTDKVKGYVRSREPLRFICDHCLQLLEQLAPQTSVQGCSIEDLVRSPTYTLEIVRAEAPGDTLIRGADRCSFTPASEICPIETAKLPSGYEATSRSRAEHIFVRGNDAGEGAQGRVVTLSGQSLYFKPRQNAREKEFDRELSVLMKIKRIELVNGPIRLPDLQGIVVSGKMGEECVGLLINHIPASPCGVDLLSAGCWTQSGLHLQWEKQVMTTLEALHAHDIVWGDVNPGNVVIDESSNAWLIDFGGMNNPEFVDNEKAETVDGDWQGVRRLFKEWLPSRRRG